MRCSTWTLPTFEHSWPIAVRTVWVRRRRRARCRQCGPSWCSAEAQGNPAQLPRTRAPKRPRTLPRPASPADAMALAEDAGAAAPSDWLGARDLAILLLLYGAGLRVAEAMALTARSLPGNPGHRQARQDPDRAAGRR